MGNLLYLALGTNLTLASQDRQTSSVDLGVRQNAKKTGARCPKRDACLAGTGMASNVWLKVLSLESFLDRL
jgi:hypothetical protein